MTVQFKNLPEAICVEFIQYIFMLNTTVSTLKAYSTVADPGFALGDLENFFQWNEVKLLEASQPLIEGLKHI